MAPTKQRKIGLAFDFNSFADLEEKHGINFLDRKAMNALPMTPSNLRKLLHVGLTRKRPGITLEEAGVLITADNMSEIADEVQEALGKFFNAK